MKKMILIILVISFTLSAFSQNGKYEKTITTAIHALQAAEGKEGLTEVANTFERISNAMEEEWLPAYFHAYSQMLLAMASMKEQQMEQCQAYVAKAQEALDKAMALEGAHAEIWALQGLVYQGRIWEDPQAKGAEFSMKSHQALDQAIALDPQNPRAYYLKGQNIFFTPSFFGGGPSAALPLLEKAENLFAAAKPASELEPQWGRESNQRLLNQARAAKSAEKN